MIDYILLEILLETMYFGFPKWAKSLTKFNLQIQASLSIVSIFNFMPGRPDGSRNHSYSVFEFIRREFGQTVLQCSRKFEKIGLKTSKSYCDPQFNHRCKSEGLIPKSLRFSPPIRTKRGFKLAREYDNKFLKLRITECHIKIEQLKQVKKT